MSDSVWPHRRQPTRLPRPWDSPGKNTGVGCHFLLQCLKVKSEREVAQSCPTLSDPMDCSPPGSSVHGICQARAPEWVAIAFSVYKEWGLNKPCQWRTSAGPGTKLVLITLEYTRIMNVSISAFQSNDLKLFSKKLLFRFLCFLNGLYHHLDVIYQ